MSGGGTPQRPVGAPDSSSAEWWAAASEGRLTVQRCRECGHAQLYPRALCTACQSTDLAMVDSMGLGIVHSVTVVHRAPDPFFEPPYAVALVQLEEGPTVMTNVVGCDPSEVHIDQPVRVVWEDLPDGRRLPLFTAVPEPEKPRKTPEKNPEKSPEK